LDVIPPQIPLTPKEEEPLKKKRVKSAVKRRTIHGKKLEEMRRWLEYQRKFTAQEIKK